jgi:phage baseplate assembly protein W
MINWQIVFPDANDKLEFKLFSNSNSRAVSGNASVEQLVAKVLLTDPGTDAFNRSSGAGLRIFLLKTVSPGNLRTRSSELAQIIDRCERQLVQSQQGVTLPLSERLKDIEIRSLDYDFVEGKWLIELKLNMEDGNVLRVKLAQ